MVATASDYADSRYRAYPGEGFDGVVRVSFGGYYGTGTLLFDGRAILTAAHLFDGRSGTASVSFETRAGMQTLNAAQVLQHPGYDASSNNDLAIVWLSTPAPTAANRYDIYRDSNEIGQLFTLAGYGRTGAGSTGATYSDAAPTRLKAVNQFDVDAAILKSHLGFGMAWASLAGTQLIADFDNGNPANDALGQLIARHDLGQGLRVIGDRPRFPIPNKPCPSHEGQGFFQCAQHGRTVLVKKSNRLLFVSFSSAAQSISDSFWFLASTVKPFFG